MDVKSNKFIPAAQIAIADPALQAAVAHSTHNAAAGRVKVLFAYGEEHGEALRQQAAEAKRRALRDLPDLLERAEATMQANGIHVRWAVDGAEVAHHVLDIIHHHHARRVVKVKSMLSEEIELNHALFADGLDVVETDLGEYIVQLAHEPPRHLVGPALHLSKESIRDLFMRELDMPSTDDAEAMTRFARVLLRRAFLEAEVGISGGNFLIAETGTVCISTNEGNGRMVTTQPPVHIAIVGIEKIVATVEDFVTLSQILPRSSTGQPMTVYTHMINGPRGDEPDGPEHVYVILVDNGRSAIYGTEYAEVLSCIRCGACLNACPVYRTTGGHAYGSPYSGPIGAVITPLLAGLEQAKPLPHASSLCGKCKDVCPVIIDLPRLLLDLRYDMVTHGYTPKMWVMGLRGFGIMAQSPRLWSMGTRLARFGRNNLLAQSFPPPLSAWTRHRNFPPFAPESFHQLWAKRQKTKGGRDEQS